MAGYRSQEICVDSMQGVRDVGNVRVPTGPACSAVDRFSFSSPAHETVSRNRGAVHGTLWQCAYLRCCAVNECRRDSHRQVLGKAMFSEKFFDDPILTRGQPVPHLRSTRSYSADVVEHCDTLKIATIEPAEVWCPGFCRLPVHEFDHRLDPARIIAAIEPSLIGVMYFWIAEKTLEGIAFFTHRSFNLSQPTSGNAALGWNTPGVAGHLRWSRETTDDFPGPRAGHSDDLCEDARIETRVVSIIGLLNFFKLRFGPMPKKRD